MLDLSCLELEDWLLEGHLEVEDRLELEYCLLEDHFQTKGQVETGLEEPS